MSSVFEMRLGTGSVWRKERELSMLMIVCSGIEESMDIGERSEASVE